jgi:uncharacterized protein YbaP (TraB family)
MRRITFSLLFFPLLGWAQELPHALLWRVEGKGLAAPSYVVGTVHSRDARAFGDVPRLLEVMQHVDAVAGELDLSEMKPSMEVAQAMMLPPGKELADFYGKRKLKRVKQALTDQLGPMAMIGARIKPFFLMSMLAETVMQGDSAVVLDQYLEDKARAMGKEILGLETVEEQLAAVADVPLQEQADMLYDLVANDLNRKELDRMMVAYAARDLEGILRITSKGGLSDGTSQRLLTDRNRVMAQRMDSLMTGGRRFLFAVGAGHLPGDAGVLELLRKMGYTVVPCPAAPQAAPKP